MPYRFRRRETVVAGVRRIAREQIDAALAAIRDDDLDPHEAVHQVRQRCKRVRGLLRLVRPQIGNTYHQENAFFRDAAAGLSSLRDAQSMIECFDRQLAHVRGGRKRQSFASIGTQLRRRRDRIAREEGDVRIRLKHFKRQMRDAKPRIDEWSLPVDEFEAIAGGFEQTYRLAQEFLERAYADPSAENFHEWRKHVKYHGYHCRLLRGIWPAMLDVFREAADCLGEWVGEDHDLAMIRRTVLDAPDDFGKPTTIEALLLLIDRRRCQLQTQARPVGLRMFAHDPTAVAQWFADCWGIWRNGRTQACQLARLPLPLAIAR
ncbi:MAG: CHAD domain-containing protein [Planctomycetaceae bacterium]